MITKLNLSSRPFRNRALPYIAAAFLLFISAVAMIFSLAQLRENNKENEKYLAAIKDRQGEIQRLKGEGEKIQQLLTPDQKAMLSASHKLVANKTFAWSRLFADLESVLPSNVSASRISVENIYRDGDRIKAELELGVLATDYQSVMGMMENMRNSGLFLPELRGQDRQENDRITYTEYTFRLIYAPGYGYSASSPQTDVAQNTMGGDSYGK